MKKILSLLLITVMVFSMASCGAKEDQGPSPTVTVDNFLKAIKAQDFETAAQYYEGDISGLGMLQEEDDPVLSGILGSLTEKILDFEYTLDNEVIEKNAATVDINFKTYDLGKVMEELINSILADASALNLMGLDQEEMEAEIAEILDVQFQKIMQNASKDKTITVTVNLVKKKGVWLLKDLTDKEDFMNALSGGIMEFANGIEDTIS